MQPQRLGPYRIEYKLGRGGMGTVYAGVDDETGKAAAIKVLAPTLAVDDGFRHRFEAEINSLKRLKHPGIVRLYGYGEQQDQHFYAMEMVAGPSLEEELTAGRRFSWREVADLGAQTANAIKHAHDHGIIHRDIKPGNLLLIDDPNNPIVKLSDFGIARLFGHRLTGSGGVVGTAEYMAPEQADGQKVTSRCDQYSLGCVLYSLLTGSPPFRADSYPAVLYMHRHSAPEPISELAPDTPRDLVLIVNRLLSKDPADRFADVGVLARKLAALQERHSLEKPPSESLKETPPVPDEKPIDIDPLQATTHAGDHFSAGARGESSPEETSPSDSEQEVDETPPSEKEPKKDQFTSVENLANESTDEGNLRRLMAPQTLVLLFALGALVLGIVYLSRGPSDQELKQRIEAAATDDPEKLLSVEADIQRLRERLSPDDLWIERLDSYDEAIALVRLDKRIRRRLPSGADRSSLSVVERAYADAIRLAESDPRRAAQSLETLVALYGATDDLPETTRRCVTLARRELVQLRPRINQQQTAQRAMLVERLERAEELAKSNRGAARAIWKAITRGFREQPWAAEFVDQAERALERHPPINTE